MLEIVSQAGGFVRIVFASGTHGDIGLDSGLLLVYGHIDFEPVIQGVNAAFHRVAGHPFIVFA
jgi:hypothetical protein